MPARFYHKHPLHWWLDNDDHVIIDRGELRGWRIKGVAARESGPGRCRHIHRHLRQARISLVISCQQGFYSFRSHQIESFYKIRNANTCCVLTAHEFLTLNWYFYDGLRWLQIVETNQQCSEAWCIVGNCYSSQKDHESAVSFFERAIRIHLTFVHAYTLLGHEHVYNDELSRSARSSMYRL